MLCYAILYSETTGAVLRDIYTGTGAALASLDDALALRGQFRSQYYIRVYHMP